MRARFEYTMTPAAVLRAKVAACLSACSSCSSKDVSSALSASPYLVDELVHELWRRGTLRVLCHDGVERLRLPAACAAIRPPRRKAAKPSKAPALAAIKRRDSRDRRWLSRQAGGPGHARGGVRRGGVFPKPEVRHGD